MRAELAAQSRVIGALLYGHRAGPGLSLAAAATAVQLVGPATIALPAIFSLVEVRTTLTVLCGLGFALAILQFTSEPAAAVAATSARGWSGPRLWRVTLAGVVITVLAAATAPAPDVAANAVLLFTAEGLLAARFLGTGLAWILPTAHLLAAVVFGSTNYGHPQPWAWFLAPQATGVELTTAFLLSAACLLIWSRGPTHDHDSA